MGRLQERHRRGRVDDVRSGANDNVVGPDGVSHLQPAEIENAQKTHDRTPGRIPRLTSASNTPSSPKSVGCNTVVFPSMPTTAIVSHYASDRPTAHLRTQD